MNRRTILQAGLAGLASAILLPAFAQSYPSRPVRIIVPFAAAGPTDAVARKLADLIGREMGQTIIIDNKVGAGGAIGTAEVARAAPDGYTLGFSTPDSLISIASLVKSPGYDARTDLTMIMNISAGHQILVVSAKSGIKTLDELFALARSKPGGVSYVSWGPGSRPELQFRMLEPVVGTSFLSIPYKGLGPAMQDLVSNEVQIGIIPMGMATQYQQKGWLVPLVVLGSERAPDLPQVKTIKEYGINLPIMDAKIWNAFFGPKGLPPEVLQRWVTVLNKVTRGDAFQAFLKDVMGQTLIGRQTDQFTRDFNEEYVLINDTMRKLGFTPQ